ncbi:hypothetical protein V6N13_046428 [Hibiscus sabdariffa]
MYIRVDSDALPVILQDAARYRDELKETAPHSRPWLNLPITVAKTLDFQARYSFCSLEKSSLTEHEELSYLEYKGCTSSDLLGEGDFEMKHIDRVGDVEMWKPHC